MPATRPPAPSTEHLAALALVLTDGLRLDPGDPPCVIRVRHLHDDDADIEIGTKQLEPGDHPLDGLVGLEADDDWSAVGVAATGRLRHLDDLDAPPQRVRTTHLVAADGSWAVRWQPLDGSHPFEATGAAGDPDMPVGRIDDALRRCLGLPTAPPEGTTGRLWLLLWLDAVVTEAAGSAAGQRRMRRWHNVARLHPAVRALVADPSERVELDRLVELGRELERLRDWGEVRRSVAARTMELPGMPAGLAEWLDDGAFSRWALGAFPEVAPLARTCIALLPTAVIDTMCDALAAWAPAGPDERSH